ncbi:hypothetical protein NDU88_005446 [Pleurodeles waltl]|uniref:Uncharacterized protein n=1 Tax=Pleurodeles waltl TaxID=8319 RepID=A0AAV7N0J1_PLEWA|nr:hypothetical protein NDU88_005446 [Pleurodeles waltl]
MSGPRAAELSLPQPREERRLCSSVSSLSAPDPQLWATDHCPQREPPSSSRLRGRPLIRSKAATTSLGAAIAHLCCTPQALLGHGRAAPWRPAHEDQVFLERSVDSLQALMADLVPDL